MCAQALLLVCNLTFPDALFSSKNVAVSNGILKNQRKYFLSAIGQCEVHFSSVEISSFNIDSNLVTLSTAYNRTLFIHWSKEFLFVGLYLLTGYNPLFNYRKYIILLVGH